MVSQSLRLARRVSRRAWRLRVPGAWRAWALPLLALSSWEALVRLGWLPAYQMPAPSGILLTLVELARGELWGHVGASLARVAAGFAIGSGLALVVGTWVGLSRRAEAYLEPSFQALRAIPSLAWVPLLLLWFGIDETPKIVLIALGAFFPVYLALVAGVRGVDRKWVELGRLYRLSRFALVRRILLPAALPNLFTGLRGALSLSWMFLVAAELIAATQGLGYLLSDGRETSRPDLVIAAILGAEEGAVDDRFGDRADVPFFEEKRELPALDLRKIKDVLDQRAEPLALAEDHLQVLAPLGLGGDAAGDQIVCKHADQREGRLQLMAHVRDEFALHRRHAPLAGGGDQDRHHAGENHQRRQAHKPDFDQPAGAQARGELVGGRLGDLEAPVVEGRREADADRVIAGLELRPEDETPLLVDVQPGDVAAYRANGRYPMNGPVEIRVSGLDQPGESIVPGAQVPSLSAIRPRPDQPEWDTAIWLDILSLPGTPQANAFYHEFEAWLFDHFSGDYASLRVEWSKGWGYSPAAAWDEPTVVDQLVAQSLRQGLVADNDWDSAVRQLNEADPHRLFSSPLLDRLMP